MALSSEEKTKIRYHLGYVQANTVTALYFGVPSVGHVYFILTSAMEEIPEDAEYLARRAITELDCIESQMSRARERFAVTQVDSAKFSDTEESRLENQYDLWTKKLADIFGVPVNPYSKAHSRSNRSVIVVD